MASNGTAAFNFDADVLPPPSTRIYDDWVDTENTDDTMLHESRPSPPGGSPQEQARQSRLVDRMRTLQFYEMEVRRLRINAAQMPNGPNLEEALATARQELLSLDELSIDQWAELSSGFFGDQAAHLTYRLPSHRDHTWHHEMDVLEAQQGVPNTSGRSPLRELRMGNSNVPRPRLRPHPLAAPPVRRRAALARLQPERTTAEQMLQHLPVIDRGFTGFLRREIRRAGEGGQVMADMPRSTTLAFDMFHRNQENVNTRNGEFETEPRGMSEWQDVYMEEIGGASDDEGDDEDDVDDDNDYYDEAGSEESEDDTWRRNTPRTAAAFAPVTPALFRL